MLCLTSRTSLVRIRYRAFPIHGSTILEIALLISDLRSPAFGTSLAAGVKLSGARSRSSHLAVRCPCSGHCSERVALRTRQGLAGLWLVIIPSLLNDPFTPTLTRPGSPLPLFAEKPGDCVAV